MHRSLTDFVKVIAAIAVVGIHATSLSETRFAQTHDYLSLDFLSVFVNQWARFSVPLFIYLSAYGLAASHKSQGTDFLRDYFAFLAKRLPTILVPYLFFSLVSLAMEFSSYQGSALDFAGTAFQKLRTGGADYHLYFLVILAQCYLLFPVLLKFNLGSPGRYRVLTAIILLLVVLFLYRTTSERTLRALGLAHPGWHASFVIYWLPYFMLGIAHARKAPKPLAPLTASVLVILALANVLLDYIHASSLSIPVDYYNHFSRPSVMLYALAVIWFLHSLPQPLPLSTGGMPKAGWGQVIAPLTFSVYLIHPQVLRLVTNYANTLPTVFTWMVVFVLSFGLVYLLTSLTNRLAQKSPVWLTGPLHFFQRCLGLR